jgi:hypothetical protein
MSMRPLDLDHRCNQTVGCKKSHSLSRPIDPIHYVSRDCPEAMCVGVCL